MSNQNLSLADNSMIGRGRDPLVSRRAAHRGYVGVPAMVLTKVDLGAPIAADVDYLIKAATGAELPAEAGAVTYTPLTDGTSPLDNAATPAPVQHKLPSGSTVLVWPLAVPRNVTVTVTHATAVVALTITVHGYDLDGRALSEDLAIAATGTTQTATGAKAFAYVASIAITAAADASANTLNLGIGAALGLPYRLVSAADLVTASLGGAQELVNVASNATVVAADGAAADATSGDVRGTITFNGTLNGTSHAVVWMYVAGHTTAAGIAGVAQA